MKTAEEFFKGEVPKYQSVSEFMTDGDIFYHAREFAKMHVEEALKEVVKEIHPSTGIYKLQDDNSILNAYPLSNIK